MNPGDFVWTEVRDDEHAEDARSKGVGFLHIIERVTPSETPAGCDTEEYVAICGYETQAWYFAASMMPVHLETEAPPVEKVPRCPTCFAGKE